MIVHHHAQRRSLAATESPAAAPARLGARSVHRRLALLAVDHRARTTPAPGACSAVATTRGPTPAPRRPPAVPRGSADPRAGPADPGRRLGTAPRARASLRRQPRPRGGTSRELRCATSVPRGGGQAEELVGLDDHRVALFVPATSRQVRLSPRVRPASRPTRRPCQLTARRTAVSTGSSARRRTSSPSAERLRRRRPASINAAPTASDSLRPSRMRLARAVRKAHPGARVGLEQPWPKL